MCRTILIISLEIILINELSWTIHFPQIRGFIHSLIPTGNISARPRTSQGPTNLRFLCGLKRICNNSFYFQLLLGCSLSGNNTRTHVRTGPVSHRAWRVCPQYLLPFLRHPVIAVESTHRLRSPHEQCTLSERCPDPILEARIWCKGGGRRQGRPNIWQRAPQQSALTYGTRPNRNRKSPQHGGPATSSGSPGLKPLLWSPVVLFVRRVSDSASMPSGHHTASCQRVWVQGGFAQGLDRTGDRLCGLVGRVLGYSPEVPGSIPGATTFSE
jgi:hypothetical protein